MKKLLLFWLSAFSFCTVIAQQTVVNDSIPREAVIGYDAKGNLVSFKSETPPLIQIAGAPKAFYTYYWEFGDGNYSFDKEPNHVYKKKGEFETRLWTTNNYDNGKTPTSRPKKVAISDLTDSYNDIAELDEHNGFRLQKNREPMPEQEMVVVMSYKNEKDYVADGKLYLFYNERKYKDNNFDLIDTRTYHGEREVIEEATAMRQEINDDGSLLASDELLFKFSEKQQDSTERVNLPLTIEEAQAHYKNWNVLEFDGMEPGEERNVFHTIKTTPEMLKDTSAIVTIRGVYVPDRNYDNHKVKDMEMEIVTSHDPNKMSTNDVLLNYRLVRYKRLNFKVRFQNNGEGPARKIRLEVDIPDILDKSTIQVEDMYPKCEICPDEQEVSYSCLDTMYTDTQAIFTFKNIYLPGSEQKNVKDYDSTQGFVKYSVKFGKNFHKKKTKSRTAIIFDKNEPIITNYSTTRFTPGISIGAKAGYNYYAGLDNSRSYFVGATLSPYKSYKKYLQAEIMLGSHFFDEETVRTEEIVGPVFPPVGDPIDRALVRSVTRTTVEKYNIEVVPVSFRYNINNIIGLGAGPQLTMDVSNKRIQTVDESYFFYLNMLEGDPIPALDNQTRTETSKSFSDIQYGLFADVTVGASRIGPSVGARYHFNFENDFSYWQFYAIWKF